MSDYINTYLDRDLSLVQIARVINLSPTYFASLFKSATGISPHQYVIQHRVKRAKLLLLTTDLTIADIAWVWDDDLESNNRSFTPPTL